MRPLLVLTAIALTLAGGAAPATTPIVVAVVDSGVDPSVPGLIAGRNVFDNSADTHDDQGHGTGVARVVAAGCGGCRIMPVKIDANGTSTQGTIAAGIRWASEHGARVINLSWGLALGAQSTREVERAIANATLRGALVTTGAMNDGTRNPRINPWASDSPDAVRVTAVDDQGQPPPRFESRRLGRHRRARHGELQRRPAGGGGRGRSARRPSPVDPAPGSRGAAARLPCGAAARRRLALRPRSGRSGEGR